MECSIVATTSMSIKKYFVWLPVSIPDNLASLWKIVSIETPSSAIAAANRKVMRILQARNPEVKHSKKQGPYRKYSAEERTMFQETKIALYTISWQVIHHDADGISTVNVGTVPLAVLFTFDA